MKKLPLLIRATCFATFLSAFCLPQAKPPFLRVFMDTYHIKDGSKLATNRCLNCHQSPGPPNLNPYGLQVKQALTAAHVRMVTPEILRAVEKKNVGDGVANLKKIQSDEPPGQLKAKPAAKSRPKKQKHRHKG